MASSDSNSTIETRSPSSALNVLIEMKPGILIARSCIRDAHSEYSRWCSGRRRDRNKVMTIALKLRSDLDNLALENFEGLLN